MIRSKDKEDSGEDLNVANLMETKFERSATSESKGDSPISGETVPFFTVDPALFIQSIHPCAEPDERNPGRSLVRAEHCMFAAFGKELPPVGVPIIKILAEMEAALLAACSERKLGFPDQETLKRASDRWYELMIATALWNANASALALDHRLGYWLWLPGRNEFKLAELFEPRARELIEALEIRLHNGGTTLVSPNPNLVYVEPGHSLPPLVYKAIETYSPQAHQMVTQCHKQLLGECRYSEIRVCLGLKTFSRPDRHLWIPYEAVVLKTLFAWLQKQFDNSAPAAMRYYAVSSFEPSQFDEEVFCAASPRSILDDTIPAERAVDGLLYIQTLSEIADLPKMVLEARVGK